MTRRIYLAVFYVMALLSTSAFAGNHHVLTASMSIDYEFPPNVPQVFSNFLFWKINAECTIHTDTPLTPISGKAIRKISYVNGKLMPQGETIFMSVNDQDILSISAAPGAEVELVNLGKKTIIASCKAV